MISFKLASRSVTCSFKSTSIFFFKKAPDQKNIITCLLRIFLITKITKSITKITAITRSFTGPKHYQDSLVIPINYLLVNSYFWIRRIMTTGLNLQEEFPSMKTINHKSRIESHRTSVSCQHSLVCYMHDMLYANLK